MQHSTPQHVTIGGLSYTKGRLELDLRGHWQAGFRAFETGPAQLLLALTAEEDGPAP